jgi:two-component system LytT family response regulator
MLHAVLIDDESNGLKSLELLIKKFATDVKIVASTTDPKKGIDLINNYRPDIVFLDINMPNMNGFELLDKLSHRHFHLIFTTAHIEYALKAIKQRAIDYLLKPIGEEDLRKAVDKVNKKIAENQRPQDVAELLSALQDNKSIKVTIPAKDGIELVMPNEIIYIEASSNNCIVKLNEREQVLVTKGLKEYEEQLCNKELPFIRIHNSFIINVNYATKYLREEGGMVVMKDKKNIPISKNKKDEFLRLINFRPD